MLKVLTALIGCALSLNAMAQFNVRGTVRDAKTKEGLAGATVQIENQNRYAVTDDQGWYELKGVPAGKQTFDIKFLGFTDSKQEVEVSSNQEFNFLLEESSELTDEVVVYATRVSEKSPTTFSTRVTSSKQKVNLAQSFAFEAFVY